MISRIATLAAVAMLASPLALAQQQASSQQPAMTPQQVQQVEKALRVMRDICCRTPLTVEKARAALEAYMALKKLYMQPEPRSKQRVNPAMGKSGQMGGARNGDFVTVENSWAKAMHDLGVAAMLAPDKASKEEEILRQKGFSDSTEWSKTVFAIADALEYIRKYKIRNRETLQLLGTSSLPKEEQQQIATWMKALVPPKQNIEVVKKLLADEQTKKMIESVEKGN